MTWDCAVIIKGYIGTLLSQRRLQWRREWKDWDCLVDAQLRSAGERAPRAAGGFGASQDPATRRILHRMATKSAAARHRTCAKCFSVWVPRQTKFVNLRRNHEQCRCCTYGKHMSRMWGHHFAEMSNTWRLKTPELDSKTLKHC